MKNYMEIKKVLSIFRRCFLFFDDTNCSSVSLLNRNKVRIRPKKISLRDNEKYMIVFCTVRKSDVDGFIHAMEELKNKMLLIGNTDYEAFCEKRMPELAK